MRKLQNNVEIIISQGYAMLHPMLVQVGLSDLWLISKTFAMGKGQRPNM